MDINAEVATFLRVAFAMVLGGVVGIERELAGKPAGLRTHMLVAGASTLLVLLGDTIISQFASEELSGTIRSDPIRIFEAIIVGISFLGTGTIVRGAKEQQVEGLTTAASLLFMAAVGIAVALERTLLATALTLLVLVVGRGLRWFEHGLLRRFSDGA